MALQLSKKIISLGNKEISLETGKFAFQANASVLAKMGETIVLATVTSSKPREELDYFPLQVEYQEKLYAGGKIKGSRWVKREGRPSDEAILTARLIDRSIRPLFPKGYKNEVQVIITVLSVDGENDPDILSIYATSAALALSDIPWDGPIGAVRVGCKENNFFINPVYQERQFSEMDLVFSATDKDIIMLEAGSREVSEDNVVKAIEFGLENIKTFVLELKKWQKEIGLKKQVFEVEKPDAKLVNTIKKEALSELKQILSADQPPIKPDLNPLKEAWAEKLEKPKTEISPILEDYFKFLLREKIWKQGKRYDNRKTTEIRKLTIEAGILPRTHGSALFQRGQTQALTITTLGSPSMELLIENMEGEETKRYIHHYYMPPFSVGETGRVGWPSRREVGHGSLAERALEPVLPSEEVFPYTIRVVSEIMSSNGSTSMASTCASSLSLMDAGVPIKKPVAGIAMGLIAKMKNEAEIEEYKILTDIIGLEDHLGDMDFKVAGTADGITAMQMDVKTRGVTAKIISEGIAQAKEARLFILKEMNKVLPACRTALSSWAPKVKVIKVPVDKIGEVIGPGGRVIRQIISDTGAAVDVDDDGRVTISSLDAEAMKKAVNWVEGLTKEVQPGEEYEGTVKRIQPFGAFVEITPGKEGLVHVSEMSTQYVGNPSEVVEIGQKVRVRVKEIDDLGRINLSMLFGEDAKRKSDHKGRQNDFRSQRPSKFSRPKYHFRKDF